uniref:Uncharacterized protein n=1 Tax=Ailuropoda melanoleuca TaxID=9646 RepID=A0A7N5JXM6_AILME
MGTRGFKKSSPNCKLKVYLGKRDFVDHLDKVDLVDDSSLLCQSLKAKSRKRSSMRLVI